VPVFVVAGEEGGRRIGVIAAISREGGRIGRDGGYDGLVEVACFLGDVHPSGVAVVLGDIEEVIQVVHRPRDLAATVAVSVTVTDICISISIAISGAVGVDWA